MHPTTLKIRGLKATDRDVALSKLNACLGPVGSGKSTILDALRFLALGCVPHLGRNEAATARLMRDGEIEVTAKLSNGAEISRAMRADGPRFIGTASASWLPPRTKATEASVEIRKLFGASDLEAAENLDLRALLSASPNERAKKIEALLDASGASIDEIRVRVDGLTVVRLTKFDADRLPTDPAGAAKIADGLRVALSPAETQALGAVGAEVSGWLGAHGIPGTLEHVAAAKSRAVAEEKGKLNARKEIENRAILLDRGSERLEDLRARRDAEVSRKAAASADADRAIEAGNARRIAEATIPALRAAADDAVVRFNQHMAALAERERLDADLAAIVDPAEILAPAMVAADQGALAEADRLDAEAAAITNPVPPAAPISVPVSAEAIARALAIEEDAARIEADANGIRLPDPVSTTTEQNAVGVAVAALALAKTSPWREVESIARSLEVQSDSNCIPQVAKVLTDNAGQLRALATKHGGDICAYGQALADAEAALKEATLRSQQSVKDLADARARIAELRNSAVKLRTEAAQIRRTAIAEANAANESARLAHAAARAEWTKAVNDLDGTRNGLRQVAAQTRAAAMADAQGANDAARAKYEADVETRGIEMGANAILRKQIQDRINVLVEAAGAAQATLDRVRADLAEAEARLAGIASVSTDVTDLSVTIGAATAAIADLDRMIESAEAADARKRELDALLAEIERATALVRCYDAVQWALHRVREEDLRRRSGGLEERMTKFLRAAGRDESPYLRVERGVTEFGWRRGSHEIAVEALSGGENVTFVAALAAAVVALRAPGIRCLLIEAAELGAAEPAQAVLRGCEAIAEDLDLVMVATNAEITAPDGWTTHRSGAATAVVQ